MKYFWKYASAALILLGLISIPLSEYFATVGGGFTFVMFCIAAMAWIYNHYK